MAGEGLPVHAELRLGRGIEVGYHPGHAGHATCRNQRRRRPAKRRHADRPEATALDLVDRNFIRSRPDELWVTDITEHPTREGKLYCAVVLDTCSRRVVGWSIDASPTAALGTNALGMAIDAREPAGTVIHSDQGTQTGLKGLHAAREGLRPDALDGFGQRLLRQRDDESFWSRMQVELLDRQRWRTRVELANAIFEHLEIFHNRQRRHSALGMLTPVEFESRAVHIVA